jgi:hypothetical protein
MMVSTVDKVKELDKNGKTMYLVTIEGQNYMVFDSKWKNLAGSVVKYDLVKKGEYTNLDLKEIIGKKEGYQEELAKEPIKMGGTRRNDYKFKALDCTNYAAHAFIRSGVITTPDEWLAFIKTGMPELESFLEEEMKPKEF